MTDDTWVQLQTRKTLMVCSYDAEKENFIPMGT